MRAGLAPAVVGARIAQVTVVDERALTRHAGDAVSFEAALTGRTIAEAARRGKFLWMPLQRPVAGVEPDGASDAGASESESLGNAIVGHLGMSGQLLLRPAGAPPERHERVRLDIEHPVHGELAVVFADQRTFGSLALDHLVPTPDGAPGGWGSDAAATPSQVAHIARDALDPAFSDARFLRTVRAKRSAIKRVLLDQTVVSGVGNIYADEAFWLAGVNPADRRITRPRAAALADAIRTALRSGLDHGGTTLRDYVDADGRSGDNQHHLHCYGRGGEPCERCATPLRRRVLDARTTTWCPVCQPRRG